MTGGELPAWMLAAVQTPQIGWLGSLIGAVLPPLIGGLVGNKAQQGAGNKRDNAWDRVDRTRYIEDRADERLYSEQIKANDKAYVARTTEAARVAEQQEWNRQHTVQRNAMLADWGRHQNDSDFRAELQQQSRGYDLGKLRQQADAAGINPLTLMSMGLGGYSTEVGYNAVGPGVTGGSSGGSGVTGYAAGGSYAGGGYQRTSAPELLSSGGFIADAIERGADTLFNPPDKPDPLADALREAMSYKDTVADAKSKALPPQGFGYDLTKVQAYSAAKTAGMPPLSERPAQNPANAARMKTRKVRDVAGNVVTLDDSIAERLDIPEYGQMMAGDLAEVFGELPGEAEAAIRAEAIRGSAMPWDGVTNTTPPVADWKKGPAAAGAQMRRYLKKQKWF